MSSPVSVRELKSALEARERIVFWSYRKKSELIALYQRTATMKPPAAAAAGQQLPKQRNRSRPTLWSEDSGP